MDNSNRDNLEELFSKESLERLVETCEFQDRFKKASLLLGNRYAQDLSIHDYITCLRFLTPQSYGAKLQSRFIKHLGLTAVSSREGRGDCRDSMGDFYELKCSLITTTNTDLNLVQIRPWQNINGYFCVSIDVRVRPYSIKVFRLSKKDMLHECEQLKATAAHGTRDANKENKNIELRLSIPIDPENTHYKRWTSCYLSNYRF